MNVFCLFGFLLLLLLLRSKIFIRCTYVHFPCGVCACVCAQQKIACVFIKHFSRQAQPDERFPRPACLCLCVCLCQCARVCVCTLVLVKQTAQNISQ